MRTRGLFAVITFAAGTAAADPAPSAAADAANKQLEAVGFIRWRADVDLEWTQTFRDGNDRRDEHYQAHIVVVQYGNPPSADRIDLQEATALYPKHTANGSGTVRAHSETHGACVSTADVQATRQPDPATTNVEFHWEPSRSRRPWWVAAQVHFAGTDQGTNVNCGAACPSGSGTCTSQSQSANGADPGIQLDGSTPGVKISRTKDVFTIDGKVTSTTGHWTNVATAHIVIRPEQPPKYEAVLYPTSRKTFDAWIPTGPDLARGNDDQGGNSIQLAVEVRDARTHQPARQVRYTPTFTLDASHEPGWCMNAPKQQDANEKPDLFFRASDNPAPATIDADGTQLVDAEHDGEDVVTVASRDYGAYGRLHAHLVLADGSTLDAIGDGGTDEGLTLPKDTNGNHVADAWENAANIFGKSYPATWDRETDPPGLFNEGDGYDLYEEYRGFSVFTPDTKTTTVGAAKHTRLDPTRRELLVRLENDANGMLFRGVMLYAATTAIRVRFVTSTDQLAHLDSDGDAAHPRWANFNAHADSGNHGPKQAALWIRRVAGPGPIAQARPILPWGTNDKTMNSDATAAQHFTPMKEMWITVYPDSAEATITAMASPVAELTSWDGIGTPFTKTSDWSAIAEVAVAHPEWHLTIANVQAYAKAHVAQLRDELLAMAIMHELGHASGAQHHDPDATGGEATCPMRYWHAGDPKASILFLSGHWNPAVSSPYGPWLFCPVDRPMMRLWDTSGDRP